MSKENTPSLLFIFFSFLSFLHIVQVQLLKANMRALYTQVCVCHAILAQEILHREHLARGYWLISRIHRGYICDNTTVTSFDKLNCIIITTLCSDLLCLWVLHCDTQK